MNDAKHARKYFADKLMYTCGPANVKRWIDDKEKFRIIDVRQPEHYNKSHIPGAINLPREKWGTFEGLDKETLNVVYCYSMSCHLAAEACLYFSESGYSVSELIGGFDEWEDYKLPVEKRELAGAGR